jgi:hypothetical protein
MTGFLNFKHSISKTVDGKRQALGDIILSVPSLESVVGIIATAKEKEKDTDGLPVYDKDEANWVFGALVSAVKAQGRNKLVTGTVELKPGAAIATDWAMLCEEGERGSGAALALYREVRKSFADWLKTTGKSEKAQAAIATLFGNKDALGTQSQDTKGKIRAIVEQYAEKLDAETLERFNSPLTAVLNACESEEITLD